MIITEAQVERCEGGQAWVKIRPRSPCGNCHPKYGCKSVAITRLFGQGQESYPVQNQLGAKASDWVKVAVNDGVLLQSALWGYGLPLLLLLLGAALALLVAPAAWSELASLLGAALGFVVAFVVLRWRNAKMQAFQPRVIEIMSATSGSTMCAGRQ
ncbi:SoxR reducing system RseC family protein [Deefgea sp. CFH1-16]|uniref:SoxR reducing system RseC family protein n=1 Tax=Deefgea sp. CFH1-16 TaxID=2675457 RepID=UPI0015F469BF|nr:SoxR reducing system RseC family protein [Deefgea sp. CFH1-16]MBM5575505.1 hypothetical protein [Deefgea sp. CFH1-16]